RVVERVLGRRQTDPALVLALFNLLTGERPDYKAARQCLAVLAGKVQTGEIAGAQAEALREQFLPVLRKLLARKPAGPLHMDAAVLAATLKDPAGLEVVRRGFASREQPEATRLQALEALIAAGDPSVLDAAAPVLADTRATPASLRGQVLAALGKLDDPRVAAVVLAGYGRMEPDLRPRALELLTQRPAWSRHLLKAVADKKVS